MQTLIWNTSSNPSVLRIHLKWLVSPFKCNWVWCHFVAQKQPFFDVNHSFYGCHYNYYFLRCFKPVERIRKKRRSSTNAVLLRPSNTGCSYWKLSKVNSCSTETAHKLVKPNCVWEAVVFFSIVDSLFTFSAVCWQCFKNLLPLKHILALPTKGIKCIVLVLQPFTFHNFQSGHPVILEIDRVECCQFYFPLFFPWLHWLYETMTLIRSKWHFLYIWCVKAT